MKRSQSFTSKSQEPETKRANTPQPKKSNNESLHIDLGQMNTYSTAFTETNDSQPSVRIHNSAYPPLNNAISRITLAHLQSLRKIKKPNEGTKITATCTLGLFDESTTGIMGPLQTWTNTQRRLQEPETVLIQIRSIFKSISSGKIGLATVMEIDERIKKARLKDLSSKVYDLYNWVRCVINYYRSLDQVSAEQNAPKPKPKPKTRRYKSRNPSQVGLYIRASTTSRDSRRDSQSDMIDEIMRNYAHTINCKQVNLGQQVQELEQLKSLEKRKAWDEVRTLRKTFSDKELNIEKTDISFRNKERKRQIILEEKQTEEEQKFRREAIEARKQDYDEIRKVKQEKKQKGMMCILQRGKERARLAKKETKAHVHKSTIKEV